MKKKSKNRKVLVIGNSLTAGETKIVVEKYGQENWGYLDCRVNDINKLYVEIENIDFDDIIIVGYEPTLAYELGIKRKYNVEMWIINYF